MAAMRIVIIGNGVAGMEAAIAVRKREPRWESTVISEESDHFFSRTALMGVVSGQRSHRDIEPLERDGPSLVHDRAREGRNALTPCSLPLLGRGLLVQDRQAFEPFPSGSTHPL